LKNACISYSNNINQKESRNLEDKVLDYSRILFNVVNSGMLIPKFTDKFYSLLIEHPLLLSSISNNSSVKNHRKASACPSDIIHYIDLSSQKYSSDHDIAKLIHRYYYICGLQMPDGNMIDDVFHTFIAKNDFSFLLPLFRLIKLISYYKDDRIIECAYDLPTFTKLLNIFNKNTELFKSPEAFLSILYLICNKKENIELINDVFLANFDIEKNYLFPYFISPDNLFVLLYNAFSNSCWFLLNLIAFSKCVDSMIIFYLDWLEKRFAVIEKKVSHVEKSKAMSNAVFIKRLIKCKTFDFFIEEIKSLSVYNSTYSDIYNSCYIELYKYSKANEFDC
jgi:hypothetical protein